MKKDFEQIEHTADIQVRVYGKTREELFIHAVQSMFQSIRPRIAGCTTQNDRIVCDTLPIERTIEVSSIDISALLVDFLSRLLYYSDVHNEAYLDARIDTLTDTHVKAIVFGREVQGFDVVEIKAVTHHGCKVVQVNDHWQADIVFDI